MEWEKGVEFSIISAPIAIRFNCPYCGIEVQLKWNEVDAPHYWGDTWPPVKCPECKKSVELDTWEYD